MKHFSDSQLAASILLSVGYVLVNGVWQKVSNRIVAGAGKVDDFINSNVPKQYQSQVKSAFCSDTKVKVTTLTQDTTVYRHYGGDSSSSSYWVTPNKVANPISELALPSGNTAQYVDSIILPKGTKILEGVIICNGLHSLEMRN